MAGRNVGGKNDGMTLFHSAESAFEKHRYRLPSGAEVVEDAFTLGRNFVAVFDRGNLYVFRVSRGEKSGFRGRQPVMRTRKTEPFPTWLSTEMLPPRRLASCWEMERPRPVPPCERAESAWA